MPLIIAPSIVSADHLRLREVIAECESAGADWLHVDVMDGSFVPNITMGPFLVEAYRRATSLPLDVHLMIDEPGRYVAQFASAGASLITVHAEACEDVIGTVAQIKALGCKAGVSMKPATKPEALGPVLPHVDLVLVMSVEPGFSGQAFMPAALERLAIMRRHMETIASRAILQVDGGITPQNVRSVRTAGAGAIVAAKAIFQHPAGIRASIRSLRVASEYD